MMNVAQRATKVAPGFWCDVHHQKQCFDSVANVLNIKTMEDWYTVKVTDVYKSGVAGLLTLCYGNSLAKALAIIYPDYPWKMWRFEKLPHGYWDNLANQRQYMDHVGAALGIKLHRDWLSVSTGAILEADTKKLIHTHYNNSILKALMTVYPEHTWLQWTPTSSPSSNPSTRLSPERTRFEWLATQLDITKLEDWYGVKLADAQPLFGPVLDKYNGSLLVALQELYPEFSWKFWKFSHLPKTHWNDINRQREYVEWLNGELGIQALDDWYTVDLRDVMKMGGSTLINSYYGGSLVKMLMALYPQHKWQLWRFEKPPPGFWDDVQNQRHFFEWLTQFLGIKSPEEWLNVDTITISNHGGAKLLKLYGNSLSKALQTLFPHFRWKLNDTTTVNGFWHDMHYQRNYFKWLGEKLGVNKLEDWYNVKTLDVHHQGGTGVLTTYYGGSLSKALLAVYPHFPWQAWKFKKAPKCFWGDNANVSTYLEWLVSQLGVYRWDDWYGVSTAQVLGLKGSHLLKKTGGVMGMVKHFLPTHPWTRYDKRYMHKNKTQRLLFNIIQDLFPSQEIFVEKRLDELRYDDTNSPMELDIYIPSLSLAFEFQGAHHYSHNKVYGGSKAMKRKDDEKWEACAKQSISLIEVPYWWDGSKQTVIATITKYVLTSTSHYLCT